MPKVPCPHSFGVKMPARQRERIARVDQFGSWLFEDKLQRGLSRAVGIIGPASIVFNALLVGSLVVSIMTSLLSINQLAT